MHGRDAQQGHSLVGSAEATRQQNAAPRRDGERIPRAPPMHTRGTLSSVQSLALLMVSPGEQPPTWCYWANCPIVCLT